MTLFDELNARGFVAQVTDEEEIKELINNGKATFYIGYDPTADSLHAGHFVQLMLMRRLQMQGNKPIVLLGGGTTMVGDPSGRTDMRQMMTQEQIEENAANIKGQMEKFIDFSEDKAIMLNNADWLLKLNYVEVLREIGVHFSVNRMLSAECYKQRMETGLSFLEFNYMIMQGYDFYHLFKEFGCVLQCGGDDQWSNILGGTELIRKKLGKNAYGLTANLLLTSDGKKMGKTQAGAVWLDPEKTTPFEFFQYWRNIMDDDVGTCLRMLTFIPLEEIAEMEKLGGSAINEAKILLAFELTKLIHGEEEAQKCKETAAALFASGSAENMPTTELSDEDFTDGNIDIVSLLQKSGLCASKSEARRALEQGGVEADGEKITEFGHQFSAAEIRGKGVILKRGKKNYSRVTFK